MNQGPMNQGLMNQGSMGYGKFGARDAPHAGMISPPRDDTGSNNLDPSGGMRTLSNDRQDRKLTTQLSPTSQD
jgi:hypothetical protein